jgi:hypothetical protein
MHFIEKRAGFIQRVTGAAVLFAHHTNRAGSFAGNNASLGSIELMVRVDRKGDERSAILEKVKDGAEGPLLSFALETMSLGTDPDGDPLTSCVVRHCEPAPAPAPSAEPAAPGENLNEYATCFRNAFNALAKEGRGVQCKYPGTATAATRIPLLGVREVFFRTYVTGQEDEEARQSTLRSAWHRALKKLPPMFAKDVGDDGEEYAFRCDGEFPEWHQS